MVKGINEGVEMHTRREKVESVFLVLSLVFGLLGTLPIAAYAAVPIISGQTIVSTQDTSVQVNYYLEVESNVYFVVELAVTTPPSATDIKAQVSGVSVASANNVPDSTSITQNMFGLSASTNYVLYMVAEDVLTPGSFSFVVDLPFTTAATTLYVCEIGGFGYYTLADALSVAVSGNTITFLQNITEDILNIYISNVLTIDMAGFDLSLTGYMPPAPGSGGSGTGSTIYVNPGASLSIINGGTVSLEAILAESSKLNIQIEKLEGSLSASVFAEVIIGGDIIVDKGHGALASGGGALIVNGNITTVGGRFYGSVMAIDPDSMVTVNGDIIATGLESSGAWVDSGGKIVVNGSISAPTYITISKNYYTATSIDTLLDTVYTAADYAAVSSLTGYLEYTDGTSYVYVLKPVANNDVIIPRTSDTGGFAVLTIALAFAALGTTGVFLSRKRQGKAAR